MLDLRPPEPGLTYADLVALWPHLFAFTLTFLVGGTFWVSHHTLFGAIARNDQALLWLNLMFLLVVSLLPFTTSLLGAHGGGTLAWVVYAGNQVLIGLSLAAIWGYASAAGLVDSSIDPDDSRYELGWLLLIPGVFLVSILVAFVVPSVAPFTPLLIPVVYRLYAAATGGLEAKRRPAAPKARRWLLLGFLPVVLFAGWTVWLSVSGQS